MSLVHIVYIYNRSVRSPIVGTHPAGSPMFSHFLDDCSTAENESTKSFRGWCVQRTANLAWELFSISLNVCNEPRKLMISIATTKTCFDQHVVDMIGMTSQKKTRIYIYIWPKNGTPTGTSFHQDNEDPPVQRRLAFLWGRVAPRMKGSSKAGNIYANEVQ